MRALVASHALSASSKLPISTSGGKIASMVPGHYPKLIGSVGLAHLGVGHEHISGGCGIEHVPVVSMYVQSTRSSAVVGTIVWSPHWTMYGVLRGAQWAANQSTIEQNSEMATARDGWDDVSREYPEALRQAAETLTDGGRRRRWKEETGWLRALISPAVGTNSRLGGNGRGCRRGDQNQRVGWTCHDEHWSESACATLTSALRRQESLRLKNLKNTHKNG